MTILTHKFHEKIKDFPLLSQKLEKTWNPLVLFKVYTNEKIWYILEFWRESKTAFCFEIKWTTWAFKYINIPKEEEDKRLYIDKNFLPKNLEECI